ncbi:hypothetical protein Tco_1436324, partial [Tanacetum coccineum]
TPLGYKWKPRSITGSVQQNASLPLGTISRTSNILKSKTLRGSTLSNTPLSSNSFVARRDNHIHRRLWVLKAHDGESQASSNFMEKFLVAFQKSTCYVRDLKGNDLLTGSRGTYLYSITLQDTTSPNPICLMAKASSLVQRGLQAQVVTVQTDKGTEFLNKTLHEYFSLEDGENLNKMKEKGDACIFVGYSTQSKAYKMASDHVGSDPVPQCLTMVLEQDSLSPGPQSQENVPQVAETSSAVHTADNPDKRQQHNTTHTSTTTDVAYPPPLNIQSTHQTPTQVPTVTAPENIIKAETNTEIAQFDDDEFINIFSTPEQERGETSSRHVDPPNMHTFYQHHPSTQRWTKDHPLEQVIRNPYQSVRIRCHLKTDGEICIFALTMSQTELKNIKEAMADYAWIEAVTPLKITTQRNTTWGATS